MPDDDSDESSDGAEVSRLIATIAADVGVQPEVIVEKVEQAIGFDLTEASEEDAKEARESWEAGDLDSFCDVLRRYDVDEEKIREFRRLANQQQARAASDEEVVPPEGSADDSAETPVETDTPDAGGGMGNASGSTGGGAGGAGGGLSEGEIRSIVRSEMQDAMQDAVQTQQSQANGQSVEGEGQNQIQNQLAMMLAQNFLGGGGGGQLAEQVQEEAMRSFIADLKRPDPSEVIADQILLKQYESMASEFTDGDVQLDGIGEYLQDKYGSDDSEGGETA